ncbi:hypothetical protein [Larkinella terrae]|uniref:Twin-arginine translocation signal domain-containing protein n=1 Tax=Larkinella terrae TaxID=2025311 RepID=A0A7K0ESF6_9BACT|nr:hypothetical protein [Larkinella terrae]MRS64451.1 hypothetical protein [Larkinella terrae]
MNRRYFLKTSAVAGLSGLAFRQPLGKPLEVPVRALTKGPGFHWFGYYDKRQFDPTNRYVLGMQVGFEGRSPTADDVIKIGLIDLQKNDSWTELGESRAWGWQQGCMLQWVPGSKSEVIWNDRVGNQYVSHIVDVFTRKKRTLPKAIYALSPDGRWAIGTEFSRIQDLRPGYGYAGIRDPYYDTKAPKEIGLYRIDLKTGTTKLLFSLAEAAEILHNGVSVADNFHWFNHLLINTDGTRMTFLHRWRAKREDRQVMARTHFTTRMFTMNPDGSDRFIIDPSGFTSHFVWRDPTRICAYTKPQGQPQAFYILEDKTGTIEPIKTDKMPVNGHQTYVPGHQNDWLLNDNYAGAQDRNQTPYLYHLPTDRRIDLGHFPAGESYVAEWRCDLHPRSSNDGNFVCIDSTHGGNGRQLYLLDLRPVWQQ